MTTFMTEILRPPSTYGHRLDNYRMVVSDTFHDVHNLTTCCHTDLSPFKADKCNFFHILETMDLWYWSSSINTTDRGFDLTDHLSRFFDCLHNSWKSSFFNIFPTAQNSIDVELTTLGHFYRPQRSWAKVMFLQASVILSTGGVCLSACWDTTPPRSRPPQSRHPPGADTHPPREQTTPPREADSGIRSTSGRYASYWNAFLFTRVLTMIPAT